MVEVLDFATLFKSEYTVPLFLSAALGALIGLERELAGKDPSLRTFTLISLGACLFTMMSQMGAGSFDKTRIAAQIVPGIGFLGGGVIFRSSRGVSGFTTAALMWIAAAIGMAVGFQNYSIAITATFIALAATVMLKFVHGIIAYFRGEKRPPGANPREENS
jgi:putative Mg2+ transporter-C (MgtC) family protein